LRKSPETVRTNAFGEEFVNQRGKFYLGQGCLETPFIWGKKVVSRGGYAGRYFSSSWEYALLYTRQGVLLIDRGNLTYSGSDWENLLKRVRGEIPPREELRSVIYISEMRR